MAQSFFPPALEALVEQFARLPGVGRKSAQRLAFYVLSLPEEQAREFADAIVHAKAAIHCCPICQNLTDGDGPCPICRSPRRDTATICVVADPKDVLAMERSREYTGLYHVLHGVISPMNHVGPDDLHIKSLIERLASGGIQDQSRHRRRSHCHVSLPHPQAVRRQSNPVGIRSAGGKPP